MLRPLLLPALLRRSVHATRHSLATEHLRAGTPVVVVQRLMRHSSIRVTVDTYGHIGETDMRRSVDLFDGHLDASAIRERSAKVVGK
jgi:integrase